LCRSEPKIIFIEPCAHLHFGIWDYFVVKLYFQIVLYSLCYWSWSCFIIVSSSSCSRGLRMTSRWIVRLIIEGKSNSSRPCIAARKAKF
jgi:hypothetical protein